MQSILYVHLEDKDIPELELYQMYMNVYKQDSSNKEVILIQLKEEENLLIKFIKKPNSSIDTLDKEIIHIDNFIDSIKGYLKEAEKNYSVYLLLTNTFQAKLVSNLIRKVITIKKEEIFRPL